MQDFLEGLLMDRVRGRMMGSGGLGDKHSTGAPSVSYRHNFLGTSLQLVLCRVKAIKSLTEHHPQVR